MSFARIIIYGTEKEVEDYLVQQENLDVIDEYGYTPLIQTAIVNSTKKAQLLVNAKADVNFTDLTGRTALHWACDNNNYKIAKSLIRAGANTNAYTYAGQPVLTMPYLRGYEEVKQLLYANHADLNFVQDFINAKLLGHRFELEGRIDIVDNRGKFIEVEFEGFYLEFSLEIVRDSLKDFKNNYGGKHLKPYFEKLKLIIDKLGVAIELMKYQHYLLDIKQYDQQINIILTDKLLIIPISFSGHAITLIRMGSWLVRCDRGEFGRDNGTVIIYKMGKSESFNSNFIKTLIYRRQDKSFINAGLAQVLDLKVIAKLPISSQASGNCTWANVEAVVPAMMYLLLLQERASANKVDLEACLQEAMRFYGDWQVWDKRRALEFCVQSYYSANPARKASKAAMLAAVLFQTCTYGNEVHGEYAEKILPILTTSEYHYILQSYIDVFGGRHPHPLLTNLNSYLDDFGFDMSRLSQQASGEL